MIASLKLLRSLSACLLVLLLSAMSLDASAEGSATVKHTVRTTLATQDEVTYIHTDALGSPVARTDASGNTIVSRTGYEPYGATFSGATPTIGFTGHVNDADTGLVYMQQRYYDPAAGRFLSVDPVVTETNSGRNFNRYSYVNNNPFKYVDPDGRDLELRLVIDDDRRRDLKLDFLGKLGFSSYESAEVADQSGCGCGGGAGAAASGTPPDDDDDPRGRSRTSSRERGNNSEEKDLSKQDRKSINSNRRNIEEHEQKLQEFRKNPTVREGMENLPEDVIKKAQGRRVRHLEAEIEKFKNNIEKILDKYRDPPSKE